MFKSATGKLIAVAGVIVGVLLLIAGLTWRANANREANSVVTQVEICETTLTQAFNTIRETAQANMQFQGYTKELFAAALAGDQGSTQQFTLLLSQQSGTNLAATTLQVQRVIEAKRAEFTNCTTEVQNRQLRLENRLAGPLAGIFGWGLPRELPAGAPGRPTKDQDGDGKITALDYPAIAAEFARQATKTGDDPGTIDMTNPNPAVSSSR